MNPVPPHEGGRPVARTTDPETSHEAAKSVVDPRKSQREVYHILEYLGGEATDTEIEMGAFRLGVVQSESGLRTRRRELVGQGYVGDSGKRRLTRAKRQTIVWKIVAPLS